MDELKELLEAVEKINEEIFEKSEIEEFQLSVSTNGSLSKLEFLGITIWCTDDDGRKYIEENDKYESFETFIRRTMSVVLTNLEKIK